MKENRIEPLKQNTDPLEQKLGLQWFAGSFRYFAAKLSQKRTYVQRLMANVSNATG